MVKKRKDRENGGGESRDFNLARARELIKQRDYTSAAELLFKSLETFPSDEVRRPLIYCLMELKKFASAVKIAEAIESKTFDDLADLAYIQHCNGDFEASLGSIDKCLLLKENAWAHFFKAIALRRGKQRYLLEDSVKKQIRHELVTATSLPQCPENAFLELAEGVHHEEELSIFEPALVSYPEYRKIRMKIAELTLWNDPKKCFDTIESLIESNDLIILGLAVQAQVNLNNYERALELLLRFPQEERKRPGFSKIKGDLLFSLGRSNEAETEFNIEIASSHIRSQIVGLFSRSHIRFLKKDYSGAIRDAKNAFAFCFEHDEFEFSDSWFWFPNIARYSYGDAVFAVCKALDINDTAALNGCEDTVRWQARFVEWRQNYELEGVNVSDRRIKDFETHLSHPCVSHILSEFYREEGSLLEAVRHYFLYQRWLFSRLKTDEERENFSSDFYLDEGSLPKKMETQKIHRLARAELEACKTAEEITCIVVPFYNEFWGAALKKHEMYDEIAVITEILLKFAPTDTEILWDYAYANSRSIYQDSAKKTEWGYREVIKLKPDSPAACHNLSIFLERQGRIDEAWTFVEAAYQLNSKDGDFANRYQRFSTLIAEKKQQEEKMKSLIVLADRTLARPVPYESLTLRQRLYLSSLLRCCMTEDQLQILSIEEVPGKLTPSSDHTERVLQHLWHSGLIVVDPASNATSYKMNDKGEVSVYLERVRWRLNLASTKTLGLPVLIGKLRDPAMVTDDEVDDAVELWKEVALEESLEYLQHKRQAVRLHAEIGDKTREAFSEILTWFSTAQIYMLIWSVVPKALADFESGKFTSRSHASNSIPGRCKGYAENARVQQWNLSRYRRDFDCQQSVISEVLFNRYLMIGPLGFENRPGDFGNARFGIEATASSAPALE